MLRVLAAAGSISTLRGKISRFLGGEPLNLVLEQEFHEK